MMSAAPQGLPELRQELRIEAGAIGLDGTQTWTIVDPAQHRYIQIGETAYQLLSLWRAGLSVAELSAQMKDKFGAVIQAEEVEGFVNFLSEHHFIAAKDQDGWQHLSDYATKRKHSWLMWAIHNYLFVRIPLVRPEAYLKKFSGAVAPFYTRGFLFAIIATAITGLYFVSRQWDAFVSTFQYFFSWEGALCYALALCVLKSFHELGHAFTASRFGCRVPSMGICFLVMFPMLYTDVTDAWRLTDRRQRLLIGSAGILVELCLAAIATLAWVFLPDGIFKSIAFFVATVGWIMSLAVNLNPLMRFDGYYLLSDAWGVDNLQPRSFQIGRWKLREILFGLGAPPPETHKPTVLRSLVIYAWAVWVYRFFLFLGIAVLVYYMMFKALGIFLFAVEILFFILLPISRELRHWWAARQAIVRTGRGRLSLGLGALAVLLMVIPWSSRITIPAVLEAADMANVFPQRPGLISKIHVHPGDVVRAGEPLIELSSRELRYQLEIAERKKKAIELRLARRGADVSDLSVSLVMQQELISLNSEIAGLHREISELVIKAPISGVVAEFDQQLHVGRTISRETWIGLIRGQSSIVARGYIDEQNVARVHAEASGLFVSERPGAPSVPVALKSIASAGATAITVPELASTFGGAIAVRRQSAGRREALLVPVGANYMVTMSVDDAADAPSQSLRGFIQLQGETRSFASRIWRQIASVLIRESGF